MRVWLVIIPLILIIAGCVGSKPKPPVISEKGMLAQCLKLEDENRKALCIWKNVKNKTDVRICEYITRPQNHLERVGCYVEVAFNTKNPDVCHQIKTVGNKEVEVDRCLTQLAELRKDPEICNTITNKAMKAYCRMKAA